MRRNKPYRLALDASPDGRRDEVGVHGKRKRGRTARMRQVTDQRAQLGVRGAAAAELARHASREGRVGLELNVVLVNEPIVGVVGLRPGGEAGSKVARNGAPVHAGAAIGSWLSHLIEHALSVGTSRRWRHTGK